MRTPSELDPDVATVLAAQRGDRRAVDVLAAAYLPLVYNIVGRAMNGHPDVDDVVQETMLRAVRGVGELRDPAAFRSWLVAIAIRQGRDSYGGGRAEPPAVESDAPSPDFADITIERLGLSGQRLETAEATRWLDDEDGHVLALWWQGGAGKLRRADLAVALDVSPAHAAVRVARMKERLVTSRTVVRALRRVPPCPSLAAITGEGAREPTPLWRKRLARHVRDCPWCLADTGEMIPAERLLGGLPLIAVPAGLAAAPLRRGPVGLGGRPGRRDPRTGRGRAGGPAARARPGGRTRGRPRSPGPAERSCSAHGDAVEGLRRRPAEAHRGVGGAGDLRGGRDVRGRPRPRTGGAGRVEHRRPPAAGAAGCPAGPAGHPHHPAEAAQAEDQAEAA